MELLNPWYNRDNECSPKYFKVKEPIYKRDCITFYHYEGTVLGVMEDVDTKGPRVVTQCVTLEGALRHVFGVEE